MTAKCDAADRVSPRESALLLASVTPPRSVYLNGTSHNWNGRKRRTIGVATPVPGFGFGFGFGSRSLLLSSGMWDELREPNRTGHLAAIVAT